MRATTTTTTILVKPLRTGGKKRAVFIITDTRDTETGEWIGNRKEMWCECKDLATAKTNAEEVKGYRNAESIKFSDSQY